LKKYGLEYLCELMFLLKSGTDQPNGRIELHGDRRAEPPKSPDTVGKRAHLVEESLARTLGRHPACQALRLGGVSDILLASSATAEFIVACGETRKKSATVRGYLPTIACWDRSAKIAKPKDAEDVKLLPKAPYIWLQSTSCK